MTKLENTGAVVIPVKDRLLDIAKIFEHAAHSAYPAAIEEAARMIGDAFAGGRKLLAFGNGGSASDAQHFCGEFVVQFQKKRRALPAIALSSDGAVMTACANDLGYAEIFARQVQALGSAGDIAFGISTSGKSVNVLRGLDAARELGLSTILLTGPRTNPAYDLVIAAPGHNAASIQELHLVAYHSICELVETRFFGQHH
ncbi:MAG TPA: SIS domain-containing protein [Bryobacteraceae bacterium]|jgi:D-sedoheptulose 7-phosphate isomerase|nr:SIS domain-containing protein [Bryobacteraceae bacterium]